MTYLWENYDEHKKFYVPPYDNESKDALPPYQEIGKRSSRGISVNPVLRFWHIVPQFGQREWWCFKQDTFRGKCAFPLSCYA